MARSVGPFDLDDDTAYPAWRVRKLEVYPRSAEALVVEVRDPLRLSDVEHNALLARCAHANMAVYATPPALADIESAKAATRAIGAQLGLHTLDTNYLADDDGITPLACVEGGTRAEFIPYTNRAIKWHTDGYYNPPARAVRAMVLHCVQRAEHGGENRVLDPEIVYLQLRDADPAHVRALMAPDAMTIPARGEDGAEARADQAGPVFTIDAAGHLHMRYTARTRSIVWNPDAATRAAVGALEHLLATNPYTLRVRLEPGMGLVCNNVLHDRSSFTESAQRKRLLLRARYYERITELRAGEDPVSTGTPEHAARRPEGAAKMYVRCTN
ncbi:MAG TPA: TauD/TfdA family dioxygenase [Burkholderiaceae bacterium]|nr:TauD/TfdA family dioxygenase [Burkholderiaceae bacterium]